MVYLNKQAVIMNILEDAAKAMWDSDKDIDEQKLIAFICVRNSVTPSKVRQCIDIQIANRLFDRDNGSLTIPSEKLRDWLEQREEKKRKDIEEADKILNSEVQYNE